MNRTENEMKTFLTFQSFMHIENKKGMYTEPNVEDTEQVNQHQLVNLIIIKNKWGIVNIIKESTTAKIYPNRIVDYATLELNYVAHFPLKVEVSEIAGEIVNKAIFLEESKKELNLSQLSPGLYELKITDSAEIKATIRFIKYKI